MEKGKLESYNIVFAGFMGVGKTTVSSHLAKLLNREVIETDTYMVEKANMDIPSIFDKFGENYFRDLESEAVAEISKKRGVIISCGGGAVIREKNILELKESGIIIKLTATPNTVLQRVKGSKERPILNGHMNTEFIASLMEKRDNFYSNAADITISTDGKTVDEVAKECIEKSISFIESK